MVDARQGLSHCGWRHEHRLEENLAAGALPLSTQELSRLNSALNNTTVAGARYNEADIGMVNR